MLSSAYITEDRDLDLEDWKYDDLENFKWRYENKFFPHLLSLKLSFF